MNLKKIEKQLEELRSKKNYKEARAMAQTLLNEAKRQEDKYYQVVANYHIAQSDYMNGNFSQALELTLNTLQFGNLYKCSTPFFDMFLNNLAGIVYDLMGDEITAVEYTLKAYYIALEHPDINYIFIIENNLGVLFFNGDMYEMAFSYFLRSTKGRNLHTYEDMNYRDGYNIVNLVGCCVKMRNHEEKETWLPYLQYYLAHFDEPTIHDDALLYEIYEAFYEDDIKRIAIKTNHYLDQSKKNKDRLHTLKNLNKIMDILIEKRMQSLCECVFPIMKEIIAEYPDYHNIAKMNDYRIQMNLAFKVDEEEMLNVLYQYYIDKKKEDEQWRTNIKKSLMTKVELEESLHQQKTIMHMNDELLKNSEIEDFTKVMNKSAFQKHVTQELSNFKDDQFMALFVIDLDKFKSINDLYGHLSGDHTLLEAVSIFQSEIRESDYIGRFGGDEFCIFMKNILSLEYVKEVAVTLLKEIAEIDIKQKEHTITASIGICAVSAFCSYEELFHHADEAMYKAKQNGGNRYLLEVLKK